MKLQNSLTIRPVRTSERDRWAQLCNEQHYLGFKGTYGYSILYVGLLRCAFGLSARDIASRETAAFVNEGVLAEQCIAQDLSASEPGVRNPLYYWLREGKSDNAEVDFLWAFGKNIVPLEVKAGASGRLRSLNELCRSKSFSYGSRFDNNLPSVASVKASSELTFQLLSLPLYLASEVDRIVDEYLQRLGNILSER